MRRSILYVAALAAAATAVFFTTYFFGRHPSLEAELERLTAPRPLADPGRSKGIPSLQPAEPAPEVPVAPRETGSEPLGEGIRLTRSPLEPAGMVIVADLPALAQTSQGQAPSLGSGLAAFLSRPPAGLRIGMRALAGSAGECAVTDVVSDPGAWGAGELSTADDAFSGLGLGPRNPAKAVEAAAEDLKGVPGERAIVVLAGGEAGCNSDLCGSLPPPGGPAQRIYVLLLALRPGPDTEAGMPEAGSAGTPPPVFEPVWAAPYRCLAERSGGTLAAVSTPAELEAALRRIAARLESAVVVKAFHYTGQEVKGISPGGEAGWGVTLSVDRGTGDGAQTQESELFPAAFAVPGGVHVVKARYGGQERTAAVAVSPGERAEVSVVFATGELYLQALDAAGVEIVGDSTGFRCAWGIDVFAEDGEDTRPAGSSCSFPARLELAPGSYRIRARWKGIEKVVDEVTVEAGASAVRSVSFARENE